MHHNLYTTTSGVPKIGITMSKNFVRWISEEKNTHSVWIQSCNDSWETGSVCGDISDNSVSLPA